MSKVKVPPAIQNKFKRPQFKIGDIVLMSWMGEQEYGHVDKIKERGGVLVYTINTKTYRYPCGVQIGEYRSGTAGNILVDETKRIGSNELRKRFESKRVPKQSSWATEVVISKDTSSRAGVDKVVNDVPRKRRAANNGAKNDVQLSNTSADEGTTKGRRKSYSKLDEAVDKQKAFLRKFT